jgi:hypothetical protein
MEPDKSSTLTDSVVGGNMHMHTGNIVHNHYHQPPQIAQPQYAQPQYVRAPQPIVIQQIVAPQPAPRQIYVHYKKLHTSDWIVFGWIALVLNLLSGGLSVGCNFIISVIGIFSLLPHLNLYKTQPQHPEARRVSKAIKINVISFAIGFVMFVIVSPTF